jgi:hypothetical protein
MAVADEPLVDLDARLAQRSHVALLTVGAGDEAEQVLRRLAHEPDAPMPEIEEVLRGQPTTGAVVDAHAGEVGAGGVEEHRRVPRRGEHLGIVVSERERDDDERVERVALRQPGHLLAALTGWRDVEEHDVEIVRLQARHDAAQPLVRRRFVEERDQHAHLAAAPIGLCAPLAHVTDFLHGLLDLQPHLRADAGVLVQYPRDGADAHTGMGSDLSEGGHRWKL